MKLPRGDLWVFGYGSLMWRPGFAYRERQVVRLFGYHRSLCVWSWVHRGTRDKPGLVLGLDAGGSCKGMAFRVAASDKRSVVEYLYGRELVTPVYVPKLLPVYDASGPLTALLFTVDRRHPQYAGDLDPETAAAVVRGSAGKSGHNTEYLLSTVTHLDELRIHDPYLNRVAELIESALIESAPILSARCAENSSSRTPRTASRR